MLIENLMLSDLLHVAVSKFVAKMVRIVLTSYQKQYYS